MKFKFMKQYLKVLEEIGSSKTRSVGLKAAVTLE
jgi:hypothetical protein